MSPSRMKIPSDNSRRDFISLMASLGVVSLASPLYALCPAHTSVGIQELHQITPESILEAEKIIGIEFTTEQREQLLADLQSNLEYMDQLRELEIDVSVFPVLSFRSEKPGDGMEESSPDRVCLKEKTTALPADREDLAYYNLPQLSYLIKTQQVTSADLTTFCLERLKKYNQKLEFVISFTEELALEQATRADQEIRAGNYRGPLHGIPYGLKDLFAVKGYRTTWGTEYYKDQTFDYNATVYEKLTEAGAVLVAKLAMGSFASGEKWFGGITRNPWDPERPSGGSSSGPAAAVASGCLPFAIGTETNGSMVSPCNECGTTGFRPSYGQVSRYGAMTMSWSFDKVTPICRSVEDCALVYHAIKGPDGKDNSIVNRVFNWDAGRDIREINIGYHSRFFEHELMGNPSDESAIEHLKNIREISRGVLEFFQKNGKKLIPLDFNIDSKACGIMLEIEAAAAFDEYTRSNVHDMQETSSWPKRFRSYRFIPAVDYIKAARYRTQVIDQLTKAMAGVDVFIEITWSNNWITNLAGYPVIVLPCGFLYNRPVSITFVGTPDKEEELFLVADAFQKATDYHQQHPDLTKT